jgi:hypothetical protein
VSSVVLGKSMEQYIASILFNHLDGMFPFFKRIVLHEVKIVDHLECGAYIVSIFLF